MVVTLGPGKFYGSSLPRPRFYADAKLNDERVDPPAPVMEPFLSWANEAHWSMGGLSFKRHRLQGRIEGSVKKLRAQREKTQRNDRTPPSAGPKPTIAKHRVAGQKPLNLAPLDSGSSDSEEEVQREKEREDRVYPSPNASADKKRKRVRRLGEEFDRIAAEQMKKPRVEEAGEVARRTRSRRLVAEEAKIDEEDAIASAPNRKGVNGGPQRRTSPRKKEVDGGLQRRTSPRKKQSSSF